MLFGHRSACVTLLSAFVLCPFAFAASDAPKIPGDLTGPWQLFIDDHLIASKTNVTRRYHAFKKYKNNPIISVDKPWEWSVVVSSTVLPNEDGLGYRMYYGTWAPKDNPDGGYTCLATSKDGIEWTKPNLGLHKWRGDGKTDNNIIPGGCDFVIPAPWETDPERKYYAIIQNGGSYYAIASPDGLRWKQLSKEPSIQGGDTSHFYYDPNTKLFRCTVKGGANDKVSGDVSGMSRRNVGYSESKDIVKFPPLRMCMAPDEQDDRWCNPNSVQRTHFYALPVFPYETIYVGLLQIYRPDDPEGYFHGPLWLELTSSRDGMHWQREQGDRPPLLGPGKHRMFDDGMVLAYSLLVVGDEIRMYYTGYDTLHDRLPYNATIGLATLRKDGFASLDADEAPGEVLTCQFTGTAGPLQINCNPRNGSVRVEVLDEKGNVVPGYGRNDCYPVEKDGVRLTVTWKSHDKLPTHAGALRFRFLLDRAELYSFAVGDGAKVVPEPGPTPLQVLFTFDGETDARVDMLPADGLQTFQNLGTCVLDHKNPDPAFGKHSLVIGSPFRPLNRVELTGTNDLGKQFTLAAMVKHKGGKPGRLFSSYNGNYAVKSSELIFDFDPRGKTLSCLRLYCKGISVESNDASFDEKYHHLAVTYR